MCKIEWVGTVMRGGANAIYQIYQTFEKLHSSIPIGFVIKYLVGFAAS